MVLAFAGDSTINKFLAINLKYSVSNGPNGVQV